MTTRNPDEIEQDIERTRSEMKSTLEAIEQKLAPQRLLEQAMDAVRNIVSPESGLGRTVRDNPVPLALMGIGAVWLFIGASRKSASYGGGAHYGRHASGESMTSGYASYGFGDGGNSGGVGSADYTSDYDAAGEGYETTAAGRAGRVLDKAKSKASRYADDATRYAHDVQDRAGGWARDARTQVDQVTARAGDIYNQYPIAIGIGAVLVGAIIGASFRRTKTEDDLMGQHRDDLVRQADHTAAEALRKGEALAARAIEGAREAAAEGGNPSNPQPGTGRVMH